MNVTKKMTTENFPCTCKITLILCHSLFIATEQIYDHDTIARSACKVPVEHCPKIHKISPGSRRGVCGGGGLVLIPPVLLFALHPPPRKTLPTSAVSTSFAQMTTNSIHPPTVIRNLSRVK